MEDVNLFLIGAGNQQRDLFKFETVLNLDEVLVLNLRGEPAGPPLAVRGGTFSFHLPAYAPASLVLTPELPVATEITHPGEPP